MVIGLKGSFSCVLVIPLFFMQTGILKVRLDDLLHRCVLLSLEEYIGYNVLTTLSASRHYFRTSRGPLTSRA